MMEMELKLHRLIIYRNLIKDEIIQDVMKLMKELKNSKNMENLENLYYQIYSKLVQNAERKQLHGDLWQNYLIELIARDENVFSLRCEKGEGTLNHSLKDFVLHDIKILRKLYQMDWQEIKKRIGIQDELVFGDFYPEGGSLNEFCFEYHQRLRKLGEAFQKEHSHTALLQHIMDYYADAGCGDLSRYAAFYWDNGLVGIPDPDPIRLEDLIGYEYQKEILIKNTEAFVKGKKANNVLLYGEKGTGKSSSVKALLNRYAKDGLRMIELSKGQLMDFYKIIQQIRERGQRFIIFMDDLSFEDFETEYKYIKALIEGGLQKKPENVLIYVTSNRKHLVKESWKDRESAEGEVRITDSVQEKLSLADRFGIVITYLSPGQEEYLKIVQELAKKNGIDMPAEELRKRALQWEMKYHGRSGRTAHQFINHLLGMM